MHESLAALLAATASQAEAAETLGLSLPALRARVQRGRIASIHVGRTVRIPRAALPPASGEAAQPPLQTTTGYAVRGRPLYTSRLVADRARLAACAPPTHVGGRETERPPTCGAGRGLSPLPPSHQPAHQPADLAPAPMSPRRRRDR